MPLFAIVASYPSAVSWVVRPIAIAARLPCRNGQKRRGPHRFTFHRSRTNLVISLRKPSLETIEQFLAQQAALPLTYEAVGATSGQPPAGYVVDRTRVRLGAGDATFAKVQAAMRHWRQFDLGWVEALPLGTPLDVGRVVAVRAKAGGVWTVHPARIVYVVDRDERACGGSRQFGFAYGTLPGHMESGEERFLIEQLADGTVWYDIIAFSRPRHVLARLGYPFVRRLQKRFGRDSAAAIERACD
jgi:uncharacterized protein (UPF0548 family)